LHFFSDAIALSIAYITVGKVRDDCIVLIKDFEVTDARIKELVEGQEHKLTPQKADSERVGQSLIRCP